MKKYRKLLKSKKRASRRSRRIKCKLLKNCEKSIGKIPFNTHCYVSKEEFNSDNKSLEHVIPNALGGKLKSNNLINKEWNEKFGSTIDVELVKQIPLTTILKIKRERGKNLKIPVETKDGVKYLINEDLEGRKRPVKPKSTTLPNGKTSIEFNEGQEDQILKNLKKKYPKLSIDELRKGIKWSKPGGEKMVYFEHGLSIINSNEAAKAVCKIAINYYVLCRREISNIKGIVEIVKGDSNVFNKFKYYYPHNKKIHKFSDNEISHLIHIRGKKKEKILYSYIELL